MTTFALSDEQQKVFDAVVGADQPVTTIGGYAGTGKTHLIIALHNKLGYQPCAYTGKAAHVLRQRGCPAQTIHSVIYMPRDNSAAIAEAEKELVRLVKARADKNAIRQAEERLTEAQRPDFVLKNKAELFGEDCLPIRGFIVDEASMVPELLFDDLTSFGLPAIFVGDHGQLPPVSDSAEPFNLMANPDYRLETLHRNAGPIAHFAQHLRQGERPRGFSTNGNTVQILPKSAGTASLFTSADQVISPFNKSRVETNRKIRTRLGRTALLEPGDRVICLRNARGECLFNGLQGTVTRVDLPSCVMDFVDDTGDTHVDVLFDPDQFGQDKYQHQLGGPHPFDYAYCVTCHKAQGSEWSHVAVLDQGWKWEYARWAYTAASRARERLTWIIA